MFYKKLKFLPILFIFLISLVACKDPSTSSSQVNSYTSLTTTSSSISSSNTNSSVVTSYTKDENGFYILEDDYFKNYSKDDGLQTSKIRFAEYIPEELKYKQMKLFVGDKEIPLFNCKTNMSQTWSGEAPSRMNNSVAVFELQGKVTLKLQCSFALLDECTIRPLEANISPILDDNRRVITFEISSTGQYTIELRSNRVLHLFVNDYKEFDEYKNNENVIYFGPGVHNKDNSKYINQYNRINLSSNQTVFVDLGAIVHAGFSANNSSNIKIVGSGIIDGSIFDRSVERNTTLIPYDFNYCNNIEIKGIITTDPAGWCYNMYFCNDVILDNIKIISSRSNGDGVSIQSCQRVDVTNSFIRSWDDSLVVKNYPHWSNKNNQGLTNDIYFGDCILWTDLAQSMEVGFETIGKTMENITFENITVLHNFHKPVISIHNGNNADLKNVVFKNITVEDASLGRGDGNNIFIEITTEFSATWSTKHTTTELGSIDGVTISNVLVIDGRDDLKVSIRGSIDTRKGYNNTEHYVSNVTISNVLIKDTLLDESYKDLFKYMTNNLVFDNNSNKITGSDIKYNDSSMYGSSYIVETL
ncbi:MAG: hypothetical protein IJV94_02370 [Bacilli bacterium]|nr:hypothetical protein [Bacilli bacterium]